MPNVNTGNLGFGKVGGVGVEYEVFGNRVITGMLVGVPTTASTQVTGAGASDFNVNIAAGILAAGNIVKEFAAQADYDLASAAAAIIANGQSIVVSIIAYTSVADGVVRLRTIRGTVATTGSQVAPTDAVIAASLGTGTFWWKLADCTVNRTGDTTVTQSYNNAVRPSLIPKTVHTA
jgi:hypothetical protein